MKRSILSRHGTYRGQRTLRLEPLEQRAMMAAVPLASFHVVEPAVGPVKPVLTAATQIQGSALLSLASPAEVYSPQTLDGPREGLRDPGKYEDFRRDIFSSPLDGLIDPGQLPGDGLGPDREPPALTPHPQSAADFAEYFRQNAASDISRRGSLWDAATVDKVIHWGGRGSLGVDNPLMHCTDNKGNGGKDTDGKDTDSDDKVCKADSSSEKPKDEVVDDTDSSGKPIKTDSDPETGGPDKMWLKIEAAIQYDLRSLPFGQNGSGGTFPGTWYKPSTDSGKGCPWWPRSLVGARPPRPDEGIGLSASAGIQSQFLGGAASFPTPDDMDGPDDPRASDGMVLSAGWSEQAASPPDGGQGGEPIPPGPRF